MFGINFFILVIVQVVCIFIFLSIFFFTYAAKIEGDIVKNQVKFFIDDLVGGNLSVLPDDIKETVMNKLKSIDPNTPDLQNANKKIADGNDAIKNKLYKIVAVISAITVGIVIICYFFNKKYPSLSGNHGIEFKGIFKESSVILICVALTEYLYLTFSSSRNISVKPNYLKAQIVKNLNNVLV